MWPASVFSTDITLVDILQDWLNWFHLFFCHHSKMLQGCLCQQFLSSQARLWNSLPIERFPLAYDLNGFKARINRHLLTLVSILLVTKK